jgi:UDP-N-acetyl-D-mannosaminuronic acid dehydrogenase
MSRQWTSVSVIGLGYIGLPTSVLLAAHGLRVTGVDVKPDVLETLRRGRAHIIEPGLNEALEKVVASGALTFSATPVPADAFIVAVPTPFAEGHTPDVSFVEAAARSLAPVLKRGDLVILESTSPVGTTEFLSSLLAECRPDLRMPHEHIGSADVNIAYCPERVLPGKILGELIENDRVVGGVSESCATLSKSLYGIFVEGKIFMTDSRTAEMCKLTENSFRDVNIAFANELSVICDSMGIDVWRLIDLANRHPRVNVLRPGAGVGGHCIAVDPWFIVSARPELARLIRTAREVNDEKPEWVLHRVIDSINAAVEAGVRNSAREVSVACLGLSFKPDIDDLRESPAVDIVRRLASAHAGPIRVLEPFIDALPDSIPGRVEINPEIDDFLTADVVVILVAHTQFKALVSHFSRRRYVIDVCGLLAGA